MIFDKKAEFTNTSSFDLITPDNYLSNIILIRHNVLENGNTLADYGIRSTDMDPILMWFSTDMFIWIKYLRVRDGNVISNDEFIEHVYIVDIDENTKISDIIWMILSQLEKLLIKSAF